PVAVGKLNRMCEPALASRPFMPGTVQVNALPTPVVSTLTIRVAPEGNVSNVRLDRRLRFVAVRLRTFCLLPTNGTLAFVPGGMLTGSGTPALSVSVTLLGHAAMSDDRVRKVVNADGKSTCVGCVTEARLWYRLFSWM